MRIAFLALVLLAACTSVNGVAPADSALSGEVSAAAPRATFRLQLRANEPVTLATTDASFDTILTLNGPNGQPVAENDDEEGALTSRIVYVPRVTGAYTAIVTGYGGATGTFSLLVDTGLNVGLSDAARTLREEMLTFNAQRTEARFPVDLAASDIFVASTFALTEELDSTLALVAPNGEIIAQNDDRGDGTLNSQIVFQPSEAGRYEVVVGTYGGTGVGQMMLSLAIDPEARPPFDFAALEGEPLARHEGSLNAEQPSRDYPVRLAAGQTVLVLADVIDGDLDPVIRLSDRDGNPVAANDDRGDGSLNSAFAFTAPAPATYTLTIERFRQSDTSGAYVLSLSTVEASVADTIQALADDAVELSGPELTIETTDFRVHYTLEGEDATTTEYAQATATTLQDMFEAQVRRIGWAEPIRDPDGRYRAYVADANGSMGYTAGVQMVFDNPNTARVRERTSTRTVFVIDNDFANMNKEAPPESLMRATATHEFNHVIQFGYDGEEPLQWLYESTASWTETTTVGADQDATDYTETDFAAPQLCWTTTTSGHDYSQWTFLQSMADVHSERIVVRMWENAVLYDGFEVMSRTLSSVGTTIPDAAQRWRAQNFARDYDLAPRFPRTVRQQGEIERVGLWNAKAGIEQLGAHYVRVGVEGRHAFALEGDANLELYGLGVRNGEVQVIRLGRNGVFDTAGFENATLMVFNRAVPAAPGDCSAVNYSINVSASTEAAAAPQTRFSARHFAPLTEPVADED